MNSLNLNGGNLLETLLLIYHSNPRLALALSCGLAFTIYYLAEVAKRPSLVCQEGKFKTFLLNYCHILQQRYWPTLWCFGTHAQTAIANMMRGRLPDLPYRRELLQLHDGGVVALDWLEGAPGRPVALFLPGLTGNSQTEYVKSLVPVAQRLGCSCVVFNNRGRGGVRLATPKTYCAVETKDLEQVLDHIVARHPGQPILATGISLGGIILGQYMAKMGTESAVKAAMLVSVPWDVNAGAASLELPGLNMMLNRHLTRNLCDTVRPYSQDFSSVGIDMDEVLKSRTIREFDERFTTCMFGFDNVTDYYTQSSLKFRLSEIKIPVLCVNAADDMFQPFSALPLKEIEKQPNMAMVITSRGGHIGFMEGLVPSAPFFSERLFEQFVTSLVVALESSSWDSIC